MKNHQNKFQLENEITCTMNSAVLRCVDEIKFLGVTINSTLNWEPNPSKLRKGLNKISGFLFVACRFLPKSALILIYNTLAHSKLVDCIEAWGNAPDTHLKNYLLFKKEWWEQSLKEYLKSTPPHFFEKLISNRFLNSTLIASAHMRTIPFIKLPSELDPMILADLLSICHLYYRTKRLRHGISYLLRSVSTKTPTLL